jgi:signal transduction histidine kinase
MRSPERPRRASLRARVALAAAVLAVLVGLVAAGVAALLVQELELASHDRRLTDAASLMEREIVAEGGDPRRHVDDEAVEIAPVGLYMALFESGLRTAGARDVPYTEQGCSSRSSGSGQWRTCAVGSAARRIVVGMPRSPDRSRLVALLLSVGGATLLAALVGALVSRALAGWALAPLTALGERIERITDASPGDADLGEPSGSSEVEALRATIRGLVARLGEALERSRGFAASAAHELRTPLATMMAELDLASEESPQVAESLVRVRRTVGRLSVLVERLLLLASGTAVRMTEAVAMEDVVRETVAARPDAERERVDIVFDASGMIRGDEALLRVVIDNMIDNALKFAPSGKVQVRVAEDAGNVVVTVRDEGPGVDPAEAARLLRPFTRGTQAGSSFVPGHGLGLSIVAHAVRLHGGDVRFVTRERGAELLVTLPMWTAVERVAKREADRAREES